MRKKLISYLPPELQKVLEFQYLTGEEQKKIDHLAAAIDGVLNNQFIDDADELGVRRYESIFKIIPKATDSLNERKFRIKLKMSEQLPFTMRALERQLENLCGADGYEIKLNHNAYHLSVKIMVVERNNVEDVRKMLLRMVPANLLLFFIVQAPEAQTTVHIGAAQCGGYSRVTLPQLEPDRKAYSTVPVGVSGGLRHSRVQI